jgi:tetratricopeptide (TPR) repeat protein
MNDRKAALRTAGIAAALAVVTLAVYARVTQNAFLTYDDPDYVTQNPPVARGLSWAGLLWAFTSAGHAANWHPLTWLSHMLDCQLFGLNAAAHHVVNLLLHAVNAMLLFHVARRMTGAVWRSAFVAALFAWHPLHVESVAWIAERKDVLSALFWLLTMLAWLRYVEQPGPRRYLAALALFACGLMSKPMVVTLPCVLLLLDLWPLRRMAPLPPGARAPAGPVREIRPTPRPPRTFRQLVVEKLPFFALTVAACVVTFYAQRQGQAVADIQAVPLSFRVPNALVAYFDYLVKTLWPADLAVFYPLPPTHPPGKIALAVVVLLGVSALALRETRRRPWLLVGWLWFLGTLVPVIGLVQVGDQALADRYTYLPLIGLGFTLAWGAAEVIARVPALARPVQLVALAALAAWGFLTARQVALWKDDATLFRHAAAVTRNNNVAFNVLGHLLVEAGRTEEARQLFAQSLKVRPQDGGVHQLIGDAWAKEGRFDEAIAAYREALRLNPALHEGHNALGKALFQKGQASAALAHFAEAARLRPNYVDARLNHADVLLSQGQLAEAAAGYVAALKLRPDSGLALFRLGNLLLTQGRTAEAIPYFQQLLRVDPNSVDALNRLAWILATHAEPRVRNGAEAVRLAARACELTRRQQPHSLNTLAAALAEVGRFDDAVATAQQAAALAQAAGQTNLAAIIQNLLQLYQARQPYREGAP